MVINLIDISIFPRILKITLLLKILERYSNDERINNKKINVVMF